MYHTLYVVCTWVCVVSCLYHLHRVKEELCDKIGSKIVNHPSIKVQMLSPGKAASKPMLILVEKPSRALASSNWYSSSWMKLLL